MFSLQLQEWIDKAWQVRLENFPRRIHFDYPVQTESISLTGVECALECAHCGGHYLQGMRKISEIQGQDLSGFGFRSALISGGCTADGRVPFLPSLEFLRELKQRIRLNFHVGLIKDEEIPILKDLADVVSFDFVADEETIREVYGISRSPKDYAAVYQKLRQAVPVMPHLTLGLKGGEWQGEERALDKLEELGLDGLVFIVFIPTSGTRYADQRPPRVEEVVEFLAKARVRFPDIPLALGCMRPKGRYRQELDEAAVALGINRLVLPTPGARELAEKLGLAIERGEECCAL
ncbi:MAG: radical SAM protein [Desulfitobacteriaceae bacterium]